MLNTVGQESLNKSMDPGKEKCAKGLFKLVTGVMNGAFGMHEVEMFCEDIDAFRKCSGEPTFVDANAALKTAIDSGYIPPQGMIVLKNLAKLHGHVLEQGLLSVVLDDVDTCLDSPDSQSVCVSDQESDGEDAKLPIVSPRDEMVQIASVTEVGPQDAANTLPAKSRADDKIEAAKRLFNFVKAQLNDHLGDGPIVQDWESRADAMCWTEPKDLDDLTTFQASCKALAAVVTAEVMPAKNVRELCQLVPTFPIHDLIGTALELALVRYLCPKCEVNPCGEQCVCKGTGFAACGACTGDGRYKLPCRPCQGSGYGGNKRVCFTCRGTGLKVMGECRKCSAQGKIACLLCDHSPATGAPRSFCSHCCSKMKEEQKQAQESRRTFRRDEDNKPPAKGVSIERCNRAELTRLQNLWLERQSQQMPGGGRACSGQVLEAWKVDNPFLAYEFQKRREALKDLLGREADKLEGFHGTHPDNVVSICSTGFDAGRRAGQVYGAGEYFAKNPHVSVSYARGGQYMLVCRLSLGSKSSTPSNLDGDHIWVPENGYYVIKQPDQVLVQYIVKFESGQAYGHAVVSASLEKNLSKIYSTKPPPERRQLPRPRPCNMTRPETTALWIGFISPHIPENDIKRAVKAFLTRHAADYPIVKLQVLSTFFAKAHVLCGKPIPQSIVKRLNQCDFVVGGEITRVCVNDFYGSPEEECRPKTIAGFCRGRNLRFTAPCWCKHGPRPTEGARYTLTPIALDGAKGDEIISKFTASSPFHNGHPRVVGLKQIRNDALTKCHEDYRSYLKNKHGEEPAVQELYHGTNNNITDILYTHGLQPPSDMQPSDSCPVSGGKGLCTSLCNNDCVHCTTKHEWGRCHMYGLGIYLADMSQKSHRYISQPEGASRRKPKYRMIICSVLGKSYEVDGFLKGDRVMHDVADVRNLTEEDMEDMIEQCQPCRSPGNGVGATIVGYDGTAWGRVISEQASQWQLHTGRLAKKCNEGSSWIWCSAGALSAEATETAAEKSDLMYVKGLGSRTRVGFSVVNSEYVAFHPYQCLPIYEIEYEIS